MPPAFAAGVHVFPGGAVDAADADTGLASRSVLSPDEAAKALGGDLGLDEALATYLAAIRELFEEAGILLADTTASPAAIAAARSALLRNETTLADVAAELGLTLRTDLLVPLARWVTPSTMPRRFDARFFAAAIPDGAEATFEGGEVVDHAWLRPADALAAMAAGTFGMWLPTSTTLQQLEHAGSMDEIRRRLAPGPLGPIVVERPDAAPTRIVMPAGGGVASQPVCVYLVGRRRFVLIDPGDPTGDALARVGSLVAERGGTIEAAALTHVDPDHAAGAGGLAEELGIPILVGPDGGRALPYAVRELADLEALDAGDVPGRAVHAPGPRPDHLALIVGGDDGPGSVIAGDLDRVRGARSIPSPSDEPAWTASIERLRPTRSQLPLAARPPGVGCAPAAISSERLRLDRSATRP